MATKQYQVGTGYSLIVGNIFQNNDLVINGNGSNTSVSIESTQILGINIPTTLTGRVNNSPAFLATLINNGVSFVGSVGNENFDASKYIGNVKFNGYGGTNTLKGAAGDNVFTHDYVNCGVDKIIGGADKTIYWKKYILFGPTESKTYEATNKLLTNGTNSDDVFRFVGDGDQFKVFKDGSSHHAIEACQFDDGKVVVNGAYGKDHANVTKHEGVITFNGDDGDDTLSFEHGKSGAGTTFNGGADIDTLIVYAQTSGSTLVVTDAALTNPSSELVTLSSVEQVVFYGSSNSDSFDASAFTGKSKLNGGDGADTLKASIGGSEITGGNGADIIHLGAGADRVIYDANGQSTVAQLDKVHGFDTSASGDDLVFAFGNAVQENKPIIKIPVIGSEIRFNDGVVEYRATQLSSWKTDLEDLSFGGLGITSLQKAANAVAIAAGDHRIAAFEYDENWYVIEAGSGDDVDNVIHLVGTTLNTSTNVNDFVGFLPA